MAPSRRCGITFRALSPRFARFWWSANSVQHPNSAADSRHRRPVPGRRRAREGAHRDAQPSARRRRRRHQRSPAAQAREAARNFGGWTLMPKIFFATDLHGSETCWRKFINAARYYEAEVLICGGDMTGKAIIPLVEENGTFEFSLSGERELVSLDRVEEAENLVRRKGYYPV